jgi:hypothetical protein
MVFDNNGEVIVEDDMPIMNEPQLEPILVLQCISLEVTKHGSSWKIVC